MAKIICVDCGKTVDRHSNYKRCADCARAKRRQTESGRISCKKMTYATCPGCGKRHRIFTDWTGKGEPRLYCRSCSANPALRWACAEGASLPSIRAWEE